MYAFLVTADMKAGRWKHVNESPKQPDVAVATDTEALAAWAEQRLREAGTADRAVHEKAYLKSSLNHLGAPLTAIRAVAKQIKREHPEIGPAVAFVVADVLWAEPFHERRMLAVVLLELYADAMTPADLVAVERLVRDSHTWAYVDGLAGDVAADVVLRHPGDGVVDSTLRRWGHDENFWLRRSALLAHLDTVGRRGGFDGWERFCELADEMLDEREFFIRKAIGWVLREAGKRRPRLVVDFLAPRTARVSGVTLREAVRYLDPVDAAALTTAYQSRPRVRPGRSSG